MDTTDIVRQHYNENVLTEWNRIEGRPEFLLATRFMDRYIKPGDRVLDIGGGPGRYSFYLAERGCDVTLFDLASGNIAFARERADALKIKLSAICGDARHVDEQTTGLYDSVLLMGPLYHLLDEADRVQAVNAALKCLKPGGILFASFISVYGGLIYMVREAPDIILSPLPMEVAFRDTLVNRSSYAGDAFTKAFFIQPREVEPFMARFPLQKLHLFGQEGVMAHNEETLITCPPEVISALVDFSEKVCENPELLSWSEHLMYVGVKRKE